jgi:hypothetical protein
MYPARENGDVPELVAARLMIDTNIKRWLSGNFTD